MDGRVSPRGGQDGSGEHGGVPIPHVDVAPRVGKEGAHGLAVAGVRRGEDVRGQGVEQLVAVQLLRELLLQNIRCCIHREHAVVIVILFHGVMD